MSKKTTKSSTKSSSKATEQDYDSLKVLALKELCKKRKIPTNGLKSEIVKRLKAFDKSAGKSSKTAPARKTKKVEESEPEEEEEESPPPKKNTKPSKTSKTKKAPAKKPVKKSKAKVVESDEDEDEEESEEKPKGKKKVVEPESENSEVEEESEEEAEVAPKKSKGKAKVAESEEVEEESEEEAEVAPKKSKGKAKVAEPESEEESEEEVEVAPKKSKSVAKKSAAKAKGSKKATPESEENEDEEEDQSEDEDNQEEPEDEEDQPDADQEEEQDEPGEPDEEQAEPIAEPEVDLITAIIDKDVAAYHVTPQDLVLIAYKAISAAASSRDIEVDQDGLREIFQKVSNDLRPFGIARAGQLAALKKAGHTKLVPGTKLVSVGPKQAAKAKKATPKKVVPKGKTPQKGVKSVPQSPKAPQKTGPSGSKPGSPKSAKPKEKEEDDTLLPMQIKFDEAIGAYCMGAGNAPEFVVDFTTKSVVGRVTVTDEGEPVIRPLDKSDIPYFIENGIRFILIASQKELDEILAKNLEQHEADKPSQGEGEADGIEIPTGDAEEAVDEGLEEITDPAAPQIDEDKFTRFVAVQLGTANQLDYTAIAKEAGLTDLEGQQIMVNYKAYFDKYPHAVVDATVKKVPVKGPGGQKPVKAGRKMLKK